MLSCQLEGLALDGVLWSIIACTFVFTACIIVMIYFRTNKKK
jgi:hypothetical protein